MGNLLQSSQNKTTTAPCYYNKYLCSLATQGEAAACKANYACASPLQTQAFAAAGNELGNTNADFQNAAGLAGQAGNVNVVGASAPYLSQAANANTGQMAQCYMSPYLNSAVQNVQNVGERNIQQNLAPQATAAAVGSGQFGSQRGAQALGQVEANAMQCLNNTTSQMENNAYKCALTAAEQKQNLLKCVGSTAGTEATNQANVLNQASSNMANTGAAQERAQIACLCAVSKLGAECQAIRQNKSCFCLAKENKLAGVLQGAQIPTGVKTTMCASPLSALSTVGSGVAGILCQYGGSISKGLSNIFGCCSSSSGSTSSIFGNGSNYGSNGGNSALSNYYNNGINTTPSSPNTFTYNNGNINSLLQQQQSKNGGSIKAKTGGAIGCASKQFNGALPYRR